MKNICKTLFNSRSELNIALLDDKSNCSYFGANILNQDTGEEIKTEGEGDFNRHFFVLVSVLP